MDSNKPKSGRGGKREGSGRKTADNKTAMSLKLDNDLYKVLNEQGLNKNGYINDAVRYRMEKEKLIEKKKKE